LERESFNLKKEEKPAMIEIKGPGGITRRDNEMQCSPEDGGEKKKTYEAERKTEQEADIAINCKKGGG